MRLVSKMLLGITVEVVDIEVAGMMLVVMVTAVGGMMGNGVEGRW